MAIMLDLAGNRVRLRTSVASDRDRLVEIRGSDAVQRWWRGDDLEAEFDAELADTETHRLTLETEDGRIVGLIQFTEEDDPEYRSASIDVYVDPAFHRQGFATDAIRTLADHLFDARDHHRLTIDPAVDNAAAVACYRRIGFRPVGILRQYEQRTGGSWGDGLLMELLRDDRDWS